MSIVVILIIILLVFAVGGTPGVGWNHNWGYGPSGIIGIIVIILIVLLLMGRL